MKKTRWLLAAFLFPAVLSTSLQAQWRFDPSGFFYTVGEPSKDFDDFGYLSLAVKSAGTGAPSDSALFDKSGKRYPFARLNTDWTPASGIHPFFEFSTVAVDGLRYDFAGRFLDNRVFAGYVTDPRTVVAEGVLTKFVGGMRRAEAPARFTYFARLWDKNAALMFAAQRGDLAAVKDLLAEGADANALGPYALSVLEYAVASGRVEVVKVILMAGADVNAEHSKAAYDLQRTVLSDEGRTALMHAAARKDGLEIVERLIRAGAAVNARDWRGATALGYAIFGSAEIAAALVRAGADVNSADEEGRTALMRLARSRLEGKVGLAEILLAAGADPKAVDKAGQTALSIARAGGNDDIARILLKAEIRK
jgi:ankyrin repeat protein